MAQNSSAGVTQVLVFGYVSQGASYIYFEPQPTDCRFASTPGFSWCPSLPSASKTSWQSQQSD